MQNYSTKDFSSRGFWRLSASLFFAAALGVLAGCGSGGAGDGPTPTGSGDTTTPTVPVSSIQLLAAKPTIDSSGANTVELTAVVLSSTRQALSGRTVAFSSSTDSSAFINTISNAGISDDNGLVTAELNLGSNKANRTITVSATSDTTTASVDVDVTGTTLTISGNSSLAFGASTTLTFSVKDSAGTAMSGVSVSVASKTGNTIALSPTTGVTDAAGQVKATITASAAGDDTITASAAGTTATQTLTISSDSFSFDSLANTDIPLGTAQAVSVTWANTGTPVSGKAVTFTTSRGTVTGSPATTNASGVAGVTVSSATTAGPAIVTATGPGGTPAATLDVTFVATSASSVTAQAVPGTVAYTTGSASQTNNSSTISVIVRDSNNNLVKNAAVNFTITADPSNGKLTSNNVTTNVSGSASVTYVAGSTSSPANGVVITASVTTVNGTAIAPISASTSLTVANQANLVSLGTDNLVGGTAPNNTRTYVAKVTDTASNPVVGATVVFSLQPAGFQKGYYMQDTTNNRWVQVVTATCANEDLNFDGILQAGEDLNGNGKLDPGGVATVNPTGVTDADGNAEAVINYPKDHSNWAAVTLYARTGVAGNDPPTSVKFYVPGLASDYASLSVSPPGQTSPYGAGASCFDTN